MNILHEIYKEIDEIKFNKDITEKEIIRLKIDELKNRNQKLVETLDSVVSISELLIREGSVIGPASLNGICHYARKILHDNEKD